MQLEQVIAFLTEQKTMIDETIACLERLGQIKSEAAPPYQGKRRGRKFMNPEDRERVSERMKEYWAQRREQKTQHAGHAAA